LAGVLLRQVNPTVSFCGFAVAGQKDSRMDLIKIKAAAQSVRSSHATVVRR